LRRKDATRKEPEPPPEREATPVTGWATAVIQIGQLLTTLADSIGFPGLVLVALFVAIDRWATAAQKERIIGTLFALENNVAGVSAGVFGLLMVYVVRRVYEKRIELLEAEIAREGNEKSELQEMLVGSALPHGQPPRDDGSKLKGAPE
jgi:hypothetical protein